MAVDRDELIKETFWSDQPIPTLGNLIKFVAEVVSSNWQNDYARKVKVEGFYSLSVWIQWEGAIAPPQQHGSPWGDHLRRQP